MTYKNVIGYCLLGSLAVLFVGDLFHAWYEEIGWWTFVATPISVAFVVSVWALIQWLLED